MVSWLVHSVPHAPYMAWLLIGFQLKHSQSFRLKDITLSTRLCETCLFQSRPPRKSTQAFSSPSQATCRLWWWEAFCFTCFGGAFDILAKYLIFRWISSFSLSFSEAASSFGYQPLLQMNVLGDCEQLEVLSLPSLLVWNLTTGLSWWTNQCPLGHPQTFLWL